CWLLVEGRRVCVPLSEGALRAGCHVTDHSVRAGEVGTSVAGAAADDEGCQTLGLANRLKPAGRAVGIASLGAERPGAGLGLSPGYSLDDQGVVVGFDARVNRRAPAPTSSHPGRVGRGR